MLTNANYFGSDQQADYYFYNMVSILMPTKNAELFLHDTIDSILNQSYQEWELVAVNDHSTDDTIKVLRQYADADPRISVLDNLGQGIIPALNLAYAESKGKWITRMDADDIMPTHKLETMVEALRHHGPNTVVTGLVEYFSDDELANGFINYAKWLNETMLQNLYHKLRFKECVIPSPAWMMRRKDLDRIGGITANLYPEDYELCLRILHKDMQLIAIPSIIHHWRDHSQRASRNDQNYLDNLFAPIKVKYILLFNQRLNRAITVYGAGKKGKKIANALINEGQKFTWISSNPKKIAKHIYGVEIISSHKLEELKDSLIIVAISGPDDQKVISSEMDELNLIEGQDYFFFC